MFERVIENWLDNSTERTFHLPFCYALQNEGYTLIHVARHGSLELGKDIITINPDGIPCAFQLKAAKKGRMSLIQWRAEVEGQLFELVETAINHPSIDPSIPHQSYLVTNGVLEEEVSRTIDDYNRTLERRGRSERLSTIVRGEMLSMFNKLEEGLWPTELRDIRTLLELYLQPAKATTVDKEKLSAILTETLFLDETSTTPNKAMLARSIASAGLLCAISSSSFTNEKNYVAEIDAWTLYLASVLACIERYELDYNTVSSSVNLGLDSIYNSLDQLSSELMERDQYVEGDPMQDPWVYPVRMTRLVSLMSIYGMWRRRREESSNTVDDFIRSFVRENIRHTFLWGEAAVPQYLAMYWYMRSVDGSIAPESLISGMIEAIITRNDPREENMSTPLIYPYYDEIYVLSHLLSIAGMPLTNEKVDTDFKGGSYSIEGLIHLYVKLNWKQDMKLLWPGVTRLSFLSYYPNEVWQYYLWRNDTGVNHYVYLHHRKEWSELKDESMEHQGDSIPVLLKNDFIIFILFINIFPHRIRADVIRRLNHISQDRSEWKW